MDFKDLKVGDSLYILESAGTFIKTNAYHIGSVATVGQVYDDTSMQNPYLSNVLKKKLIDITISCNGIQKKLTVNADKSIMNDVAIGLTIATERKDLISQVTQQYNECQAKIASIEYYRNEANKCRQILEQLEQKDNREGIKVD